MYVVEYGVAGDRSTWKKDVYSDENLAAMSFYDISDDIIYGKINANKVFYYEQERPENFINYFDVIFDDDDEEEDETGDYFIVWFSQNGEWECEEPMWGCLFDSVLEYAKANRPNGWTFEIREMDYRDLLYVSD